MGNIIKFAGAATFAAPIVMFVAPASADSLHGYCTSPTPACIDNGNITPTTANPPTFAFLKDGAGDADVGNFYLEVLVPNSALNGSTLSFMITGTNTAVGSLNSAVYSMTAFGPPGNPMLSDYLGIPGNANPLGAFIGLTQAYAPAATGYYVYQFDFGNVDFGAGDPSFSSNSGLPIGSVILAYFDTCKGKGCTGLGDWVSTPNSAALILTTDHVTTPEPATISLFGAGLIALRYRRRKRAA